MEDLLVSAEDSECREQLMQAWDVVRRVQGQLGRERHLLTA